jgi:hypothetical protein
MAPEQTGTDQQGERRLISVSEEERDRLLVSAESYGPPEHADFLRSLADRYEEGLDRAEANRLDAALAMGERRTMKVLYDAVFAAYVEKRPLTEKERRLLDHFHALCEVAGYREGPWNSESPTQELGGEG